MILNSNHLQHVAPETLLFMSLRFLLLPNRLPLGIDFYV